MQHKLLKFIYSFEIQHIQSKVRWRFHKILWPSQNTIFSHIVSAETILFWTWKSKGHSASGPKSQYKCAETIQGRKLQGRKLQGRKYGMWTLSEFVLNKNAQINSKGLLVSLFGPKIQRKFMKDSYTSL